MDFTTENPINVVVAAFWLVEGRRSIFKRIEAVTYSCVSTFYCALAAFYPPEYDSHACRKEIIESLHAGETVHIDCWGIQVVLLPSSYKGRSGAAGSRRELEYFISYGKTKPKQLEVSTRPR